MLVLEGCHQPNAKRKQILQVLSDVFLFISDVFAAKKLIELWLIRISLYLVSAVLSPCEITAFVLFDNEIDTFKS